MSISRIPLSLSLLFALGLTAPEAGATITLISHSNYLRTVINDTTNNELIFFAGRTQQTSGDCTMNNPSFTNPSLPCNSCAKLASITLGSEPCNDNEIHQSLPFQITLRSDQAEDYVNCTSLIVGRVAGETTIFAPDFPTTTITPGRAGQDVTASFSWSKLCQAAGGEAGCTKSFNKKFEFSFDRACNQSELQSGAPQIRVVFRFVATSPKMTLGCGAGGGTAPAAFEGLCNYVVVPGDEKVFIRNTEGVTANAFDVPDLTVGGNTGDVKDASGMKYAAFRVYFLPLASGAPSQMNYTTPFSDLAISGTTLSESRVQGLTNGVEYMFWGSMVDQAGTVTHFPDISALTTDQQGTPEKVFGLLDEKGCFVATAAYGTPQAGEIQILREFRDVVLARTETGRAFIRWYYEHSPEWAAVIRDHEMLRGVVRAFLDPMIGMANLSLRYGAWVFYVSLVVVFSLLLGGVGWAKFRRQRGSPGGVA